MEGAGAPSTASTGVRPHEGSLSPLSPLSRLSPLTLLELPSPARGVTQAGVDASGRPVLQFYYGAREISFDEGELDFGEALARQARFVAHEATTWGVGREWHAVEPLLADLVAAGVLRVVPLADTERVQPSEPGSMRRSSPLAPSTCPFPRTWQDCESITGELTGRPVEEGYLELVVPVFRVAHVALDADARQVGEANVFPRALRLDVPTTWIACSYPGTRHMSARPMNVTALKAMRRHWPQMMAVLRRLRTAYLRRFPDANEGWTVGRVERCTALVLAVPTFQVLRGAGRGTAEPLHPVLSSVFRVTDGLRMTMHQMLFVPIGEPARAPNDPVSSRQVFDYAERNYSFHSETGVCAGPPHMIQEFLQVLLDGAGASYDGTPLDAAVKAALDDVEPALDYGLYGLQAYAAMFSLWPAMTRAYEQLGDLVESAALERSSGDGSSALLDWRNRLRAHLRSMKHGTYLGVEEWRLHREQAYVDMYEQCRRGLSVHAVHHDEASLLDQLAPSRSPSTDAAERALADVVVKRMAASPESASRIAQHIVAYLDRTQAILRVAITVQERINRLLGRRSPTRAFSAREADVHNLLQGAATRRIPYLVDDLEETLDIDIVVDAHTLTITQRERTGGVDTRRRSADMASAEQGAERRR